MTKISKLDLPKTKFQIINKFNYQKWYTNITLHVGHDFKINIIALMDTGADYNCIREGIIPTKYYEKNY